MFLMLLSLLVYCAIPGLNTGINIVGIIKQGDSNEERRQCTDTWYCNFSFFYTLTVIQMLPIVLIFCVLCGFVVNTFLIVVARGVLRCRLTLLRLGTPETDVENDAGKGCCERCSVTCCVATVLSWLFKPVELLFLGLAFSVIAIEESLSTVIFRALGMERPKYEFHAGYVIMRSHQADGAFYRNMSSSSAITIDTLATEAVSHFMSLFFYRAIEDTTARINMMLYFGRLHDLKLDFAGVLSTVLTLAQIGTLRRDMMGHGLFKFILIIACLLKYTFALETNLPAIFVVCTMLPGYAKLGVSHCSPADFQRN